MLKEMKIPILFTILYITCFLWFFWPLYEQDCAHMNTECEILFRDRVWGATVAGPNTPVIQHVSPACYVQLKGKPSTEKDYYSYIEHGRIKPKLFDNYCMVNEYKHVFGNHTTTTFPCYWYRDTAYIEKPIVCRNIGRRLFAAIL